MMVREGGREVGREMFCQTRLQFHHNYRSMDRPTCPSITWGMAINNRHAMVRDGRGVVSLKAVTLYATMMLLL